MTVSRAALCTTYTDRYSSSSLKMSKELCECSILLFYCPIQILSRNNVDDEHENLYRNAPQKAKEMILNGVIVKLWENRFREI